jgi:hypothetical protein
MEQEHIVLALDLKERDKKVRVGSQIAFLGSTKPVSASTGLRILLLYFYMLSRLHRSIIKPLSIEK